MLGFGLVAHSRWASGLLLWVIVAMISGLPAGASGQDREPPAVGMVELASEPAGAEVFAGDSLLGRTPLRLRREMLSRVTAWFPSREAWNTQALRPDTAGPPADMGVLLLRFSPRALMVPESAGHADEYRGALRLPPADIVVPAVLTLAAGVAAVLFKQHADGLYDDYLLGGEESLLSQTEKYDIYAGVSLALLQAGLGYFIYRLFDE